MTAAPRPLCRYCGGYIAKKTEGVYFGVSQREADKGRGRVERPANKAEAQRYVNGEITSVRYSEMANVDAEGFSGQRTISVPRFVGEARYWDGESYEDEFFCSGEHARRFGYFAVRNPGYDTKAYVQALADQAAKTT
jgi:hypothetical protein